MALSFNFSKDYRLLSPKDFEYLRVNSEKVSSSILLVFFKISRIKRESRIGLSVSKKVGNAVKRNRLKRILRDLFRNDLKLKSKGLDILFVVKCYPADEILFKSEFSGLCQKILNRF